MPESLIVHCDLCGADNRVPREKVEAGLQPICGSCKKPLQSTAKPLDITDATFAAQVEKSTIPVLVDMWAPWCGPCKMIAPVLDQLAAEMAGKVRFTKLNVDQNPATADRFQVRGIPALILMDGGKEVDRIVGVQPKAEIKRRLETALSRAR